MPLVEGRYFEGFAAMTRISVSRTSSMEAMPSNFAATRPSRSATKIQGSDCRLHSASIGMGTRRTVVAGLVEQERLDVDELDVVAELLVEGMHDLVHDRAAEARLAEGGGGYRDEHGLAGLESLGDGELVECRDRLGRAVDLGDVVDVAQREVGAGGQRVADARLGRPVEHDEGGGTERFVGLAVDLDGERDAPASARVERDVGVVHGRERVLVDVGAAVGVVVLGLGLDAGAEQHVLADQRAGVVVADAVEPQRARGILDECAVGIEEPDREAVRSDAQRRVDDLGLDVGVEGPADGLGREVELVVAAARGCDEPERERGEQHEGEAKRARTWHRADSERGSVREVGAPWAAARTIVPRRGR